MNPKCDFAFWKIMGGRQLEPHEADALIEDARGRSARRLPQQAGPAVLGQAQAQRRERGRVRLRQRGLRSRTARRPTSPAKTPLGRARSASARVFELGNSYVCEKAVGPEKTCDFRSGRMILQRPIEPAQMQKLLRPRRRPTSCSSCRRARGGRSRRTSCVQKDGKVGFEFEAKDPTKKRAAARCAARCGMRVLGAASQGQEAGRAASAAATGPT